MNEAPDPKPERSRRRKWGRRLLILVLLAFVARIALGVAAAPAVRVAAGLFGLGCEVESIELRLLAGDAVLHGLLLWPEEAGPDAPFVALEHASFDLATSRLFAGELRVRRVHADGLDVWFERDAQGVWNFEPVLAALQPDADAPAEPEEEDDEADEDGALPLSFDLPLVVDAVRGTHLRLHLVDAAADPPVDATITADARLSHLGDPERTAHLDAVAAGPGVLDRASAVGEARARGTDLDASLELTLRGWQPAALRGPLSLVGLAPTAERIDGGATIAITARATESGGSRIEFSARDARWTVDGAESLALDGATLAARIDPGPALVIEPLRANGARGRAAIDADGRPGAAGFTIVGAPPATADPVDADVASTDGSGATPASAETTDEPSPNDTDEPRAVAAALADRLPFLLRIEGVAARDCGLALVDRRQDPPVEFALDLASFDVGAIDPALPETETTFAARLDAPGVFGRIDVDGTLTPWAARPVLAVDVATRGGDLARLAPYLEAAGLESEWTDARASLSARASAQPTTDGGWTVDAALRDARLANEDAGRAWIALDSASLSALAIHPAERRVRLESGVVRGFRTDAHRDADGAWRALGLATVPPPAKRVVRVGGDADAPKTDAKDDPDDTPRAANDAGDSPPWRIEVGRLAVEDTSIAFSDDAVSPAVSIELDDLGAVLEDLALGGGEDAPKHRARLSLWMRQPGLADSLELSGTLTAEPGVLGADWDLALAGEGIAPTALEPYLARANVEIVEPSALEATLTGSAAFENGSLALEAHIADALFGPRDAPLLTADAIAVEDARLGASSTRVGELRLERPELRLARDTNGALLACGLRFGAREAEKDDATREEASGEDRPAQPEAPRERVEVVAANAAPRDPFAALDALGMDARLDRFRLESAALHWLDASQDEPLEQTVRVEGTVDGLALARGAGEAEFRFALDADGTTRAPLNVEGRLALDPRALRADAALSAEEIDLGRLTDYLPAGIASEFDHGSFRAGLSASLTAVEAGGRALSLELSDLALHRTPESQPALAVARARLSAPVLDAAGGRFEVGTLETEGVELAVHRDADGRWHALGFALDPAAPGADDTGAPVDTTPETTTRRVDETPRAADEELPTVLLGTVDVGVDRLVVTDDLQGDGAEPLVLALHATTAEEQTLLDADPRALAPLRLRLAAAAQPLWEELAADVELAPFADQPTVKGTVALRGVDGTGLLALAPRLAEAIDPSGLAGGRFDAQFEALLDVRRRGATTFELSRGFGIEAEVNEVAFRATPEGEVLLGFDALSVYAPRIRPDRGEVVVERMELVGPRARAARSAGGVHALGLVVDPAKLQRALAPASDEERTAEAQADEAARTAATVETAGAQDPSAPSAEPAGEVRIEQLLVSGIDVEFEDRTAQPALVVPLTGLSAELSRFSTRTFTEDHPFRVDAWLEAGAVELGEDHDPAPFFSEASARGRIALHPAPNGHVDFSLSDFQLRAIRGLAAQSGVTISEGVLDSTVRVRLRGERGASIDLEAIFEDLSMSEPSDGPIARFLGISMPLQSALFALRNTAGDVVLAPPTVRIGSSGIAMTEVARLVATTLAKEITLAVARSPLRLTKGVADAAGGLTGNVPLVGDITGGIFGGVSDLIGGGEQEPLPPIGTVGFLPGDTNLLPGVGTQIEEAARRLKRHGDAVVVLEHEFTTADLERARRLANPPLEDCRELTRGLRRKRAELMRAREEVAADARARTLTGREEAAAESTARLRALDAELGRTELALDRTLALLQPGAERGADKRAREAAREIAAARLRSVVEALRRAGVSDLDERLDLRSSRDRAVETEEQKDEGGRVRIAVD